jgi:hypothetical protein
MDISRHARGPLKFSVSAVESEATAALEVYTSFGTAVVVSWPWFECLTLGDTVLRCVHHD